MGTFLVRHTMLTVSIESIDNIFILTFTSTGSPGKNMFKRGVRVRLSQVMI